MFSVESWEVESRKVDFLLPLTIEWKNETWELALARDHATKVLCFRRPGEPLLRDTRRLKRQKNTPAHERMKARFIECMETGSWKRQLFLDRDFMVRQKYGETTCSIARMPDESGYIHNENHREIPFKWHAQTSLRLNAEELLKVLEDEKDFQFAWRFSTLSSQEIWDEIWLWKRGNFEELQQVLAWALVAQGEPDDAVLGVNLWEDAPPEGRYLYDLNPNVICDGNTRPLTPSLAEAVEAALAWFGPHINTAKIEAHVCLHRFKSDKSWILQTQPQYLTAHERIEAAIKWREWLASTQS